MLKPSVAETAPAINLDHAKPVRIFYRDPGVYGVTPPAILKATVISITRHWTGRRFLVQPDGLKFVRDLPETDVRGYVWEEC